jgi:hypothetical protein
MRPKIAILRRFPILVVFSRCYFAVSLSIAQTPRRCWLYVDGLAVVFHNWKQ